MYNSYPRRLSQVKRHSKSGTVSIEQGLLVLNNMERSIEEAVDERTPLVSSGTVDGDPITEVPDYRTGLTTEQVLAQRKLFGPNVVEFYVEPWWRLLLHQFTLPMSLMLIAAIVISGAAEEWADFTIITTILCLNSILGFVEEWKAR